MNGQNQLQGGYYDNLSPEDRQALTRGEWVPERLAEFKRSRDGEEEMLRRQMDGAYQFARTPGAVHTNSQAGLAASVIGNALRTFGGLYLGNQKENALKGAQAESKRQYDDILKMGEASTEAVKRNEAGMLGQARALRQYQANPEGPWAPGYAEGLYR